MPISPQQRSTPRRRAFLAPALRAAARRRAQEWLAQHIPEGMRVLAIDEQYGSKRGEAYLNIVDAHSAFILASVPPVAVDGESWSILLLHMQGQGLKWRIAVSDGGKAIQKALQEITPDNIHQRDLWHVLHECQKSQGRVERAVKKLQEQIPVVERQAKRVAAGQKPLGKNPKTDVGAHVAECQQMEYVAVSLYYLTSELAICQNDWPLCAKRLAAKYYIKERVLSLPGGYVMLPKMHIHLR